MTYARLFFFVLPLVGILTSTGCSNIDKLVESGDYEAAIERAKRNLRGKDRKNPRYVQALEQAVNRANHRDVERAESLKNRNNSTDWPAVFRIYDNINRRQNALQPLIPLVDRDGREARFRFVRVEPLLAEARQKAAEQTYARAQELLAQGRLGNKAAARQAFAKLEETRYFLANYRDTRQLMDEAEQLGVIYIVLDVQNRTRAYLPAGFEDELLRIDNYNMDSQWRRFHLRPQRDRNYDYQAVIAINDLDVSPERVTERIYTDEKEITDGTEYVLDENGNVAKDSLGNDITRERRVLITADVVEVLQSKSAIVNGSLEIVDLRNGQTIERRELTAESLFENYASTFEGNRNALSSDTRRRIGNRPRNFPSDEELILQAAGELKPILQEELAASLKLL